MIKSNLLSEVMSATYKPAHEGIFTGLPMDTYQAAEGMSKSRLDVLAVSPLDFHRQQIGQLKRETTEAMELGTIHHSLLFENRADYHVKPETYGPEAKKWNGNATECRAWVAAHADKPVLSAYDARKIAEHVDYTRKHPLAAQLLAQKGTPEVSLFGRWEEYGYMLKGRADWIWQDETDGAICIADLKTTTDGSSRGFSRDILSRRYHVQAAMYRMILRRLGLDSFRWYFIALEKGDMPKCNVRQLATQAMDEGERQIETGLNLYRQCRIANRWPEYHDSEDSIIFIDLPDFIYGDVETLSGMTATAEVAA